MRFMPAVALLVGRFLTAQHLRLRRCRRELALYLVRLSRVVALTAAFPTYGPEEPVAPVVKALEKRD